jgi:hypothetical protein
VACIALFVALGGTSYAVTQLPRNSVGTKQLKKSAVTSKKIKDGTIAQADLATEVTASLKGAATSAYVYLPDARFTATTHPALDDGLIVASVDIVTAVPSRLTVTATVNTTANTIDASATVRYHIGCVVLIGGTSAGPPGLGTIYLVDANDMDSTTIATTGGADVGAGTHTVALRCNVARPDANSPALNRPSIAVVATPR